MTDHTHIRLRRRLVTEIGHKQQTTLQGALILAAERYEENAKGLEKLLELEKDPATAAPPSAIVHPSAYPGLIEQFRAQAKDVRDLLNLIQGADLDDDEDPRLILVRAGADE